MAYNTYVPAGLTNSRAYNWSRNAYNPSNVPVISVDPVTMQQHLATYEWLDYGQSVPGGATRWKTNPPFASWEASGGMRGLVATDANGNEVPARILRGYIRRAEYTVSDDASQSRLYFMFNPENITRQYVSYLDQGALDPFNTVYQSGNLVAPPSFMDFNFELFFDRQDEAQHPDNPGVLVDMEYFDLVVRNVVPGSEYSTNASLPDNGVMMVNPRDITVVFSPQLSIQGRPLNAQVVFEKFTHRMVPTRMRIALTMRVVYLGPARDVSLFTPEAVNVERRVPFDIEPPEPFSFTYKPLTFASNNEDITLPDAAINSNDWDNTQAGDANNLGYHAMQNAAKKCGLEGIQSTITEYDLNNRAQLWNYADCSSFVWGGFVDMPFVLTGEGVNENSSRPYAAYLGWPTWESRSPPDCTSIKNMCAGLPEAKCLRLWGFTEGGRNTNQWEVIKKMSPGDLIIRVGHPKKSGNHIAFVWKIDGDRLEVLHAASDPDTTDTSLIKGVGITVYSSGSDFTYNFGCRIVAQTPEGMAVDEDDEGSAVIAQKPGRPREVEARGQLGNIIVTWKPPTNKGTSDIKDYRVQYTKDSSMQNWSSMTAGAGNNPTVILPPINTNLDANTRYYIRVSARNDAGRGPESSIESAKTA